MDVAEVDDTGQSPVCGVGEDVVRAEVAVQGLAGEQGEGRQDPLQEQAEDRLRDLTEMRRDPADLAVQRAEALESPHQGGARERRGAERAQCLEHDPVGAADVSGCDVLDLGHRASREARPHPHRAVPCRQVAEVTGDGARRCRDGQAVPCQRRAHGCLEIGQRRGLRPDPHPDDALPLPVHQREHAGLLAGQGRHGDGSR
jgi:hypothetical protein